MTSAISWDGWRDAYGHATVDDQRAFYDAVFVAHPDQRRFDDDACGRLLDHIGRPVTVVELGGWDGGFAAAMLACRPDIVRWENHEIAAAAVEASVCSDGRYEPVALVDWYWATTHTADVFVASHVLEHLTLADVRRTLEATDAAFAFVQAPLADGPTDWRGYRGSHILEVGWLGLEVVLADRGYRLIPELSREWVRCYERARQ